MDCFTTAADLGVFIPGDSVRIDVGAQLLGGAGRVSGSRMESAELRETFSEPCLFPGVTAHGANRRRGYAAFSAFGLSAGVLHGVSRRGAEGVAVSTGDCAAVGQLFGARLCVENNFGFRRSAERIF